MEENTETVIYQEKYNIDGSLWRNGNLILCAFFIVLAILVSVTLITAFDRILTMRYSAIILAIFIVFAPFFIALAHLHFMAAYRRQRLTITASGLFPSERPSIKFKGKYFVPWNDIEYVFLIEEEYITKMMRLGFIFDDSAETGKYKEISFFLTEKNRKYRRNSISIDHEDSLRILEFVRSKFEETMIQFPTNIEYFKFKKDNNIKISYSEGDVHIINVP